MSRKDYELVAGIISRLPAAVGVTQDQLAAIAGCFAVALRNDNTNFNIGTFMKACRPGVDRKQIVWKELLR